MGQTMNTYGTLGKRVKAVVVDSIVIVIFGVLTSIILNEFNDFPDHYRTVPFVFIFLLYDPIFTSLYGGTLGHLMIGLRVRKSKDESKRIIFPLALLRFIIKVSLGWISLLTVTGNEKKQSVHDSVVGSVVLNA